MSESTYTGRVRDGDKPLVWLHGEIKTPPLSPHARLPDSRPMPSIGSRCHELRIDDDRVTWRIFYRIDPDALVILDVLKKKTQATPKAVMDTCKRRLAEYDKLR